MWDETMWDGIMWDRIVWDGTMWDGINRGDTRTSIPFSARAPSLAQFPFYGCACFFYMFHNSLDCSIAD
jgi:hypothetical protein